MKHFLFFTCLCCTLLCHAQTWTPITSPEPGNIYSCSFISEDTGWVIGIDSIYKTVDGGNSWVSQNYPPDPPNDLRFFNKIHFINANVGIVACGNYLSNGNNPALVSTILWTTDGGMNWIYKDLGNPDDYTLDAKLASTNVAYAVGQYGQGRKTTDGGVTWTAMNYTGWYTGTELAPINEDTVYMSACDNIQNYAAFGKATDGVNWNLATLIPTSATGFQSSCFKDYYNGWIGGNVNSIYKTTDGGATWNPYAATSGWIYGIDFTDLNNGWADSNQGKIIRTTDGGLTWNLEYNGTVCLRDICFTHPNSIGYAVGNSGLVLKYTAVNSVSETQHSNPIIVYPNPASDVVNVELNTPGIFSCELYDVAGKLISVSMIDQKGSVDVSSLPNGIYFLDVKRGTELIAVKKILK